MVLVILIRGHIRNSFDNRDFYNVIKNIATINEIEIYIHTWNIFANNISWRHINENNTPVTEEIIYNYFGDISHLIKKIIIENDKTITLRGNLYGTINNGPCKVLGWKNYWYGKWTIIDYLYKNINHESTIVNLRFDILNNIHNNSQQELIINFIEKYKSMKFTKNVFTVNEEANGIDNIYMGNVKTMHKLIKCFHYELDDILSIHNNTINQERLVYRINEIINLKN